MSFERKHNVVLKGLIGLSLEVAEWDLCAGSNVDKKRGLMSAHQVAEEEGQ